MGGEGGVGGVAGLAAVDWVGETAELGGEEGGCWAAEESEEERVE